MMDVYEPQTEIVPIKDSEYFEYEVTRNGVKSTKRVKAQAGQVIIKDDGTAVFIAKVPSHKATV